MTSDEVLALVRAAFDHEAGGDAQGAFDCWRQVAALERARPGPMHTSYLMSYASACLEIGRSDEAFAVVEEARRALPHAGGPPDVSWIGFMHAWSAMLVRAERTPEAVAVLRELTEATLHSEYRSYSDYWETHLQLVRLLLSGGADPDAALVEATRLVAHFDARTEDGTLGFQASQVYEEALYWKGKLEDELGRPDAARATLRRLLARIETSAPDSEDAGAVRDLLARITAPGG